MKEKMMYSLAIFVNIAQRCRKCDLVKHQKTHVVKDKDEMFECEVCKKTFGLKKNLNRHLKFM